MLLCTYSRRLLASLSPLLHRHFHWHWHSLRHVVHSHLHLHLLYHLHLHLSYHLHVQSPPSTISLLCPRHACPPLCHPCLLCRPRSFFSLDPRYAHSRVSRRTSTGGSNLCLCKPALHVTITCTFHISTYTSDLRPASCPLASALASLIHLAPTPTLPPPTVLGTVTSDPRAHVTRRTHPWHLRRCPAWLLLSLPAPQCHHQLTTPSSPPPSMSSHCCLSTRPSPLPCTRRSRPCCPVRSALSCSPP